MYGKKGSRLVFLGSLVVIGFVFFQLPCFAQAKDETKPERLITMAVEYPGVEIPAGDNVNMDIIFHNRGRSDETVEVWVAKKPQGWDTKIKTYKFTVTGVYVPSDSTKTVTFEAKPSEEVKPGKYTFHLAAKTRDGQFKMAEAIAVTVKKKQKEEAKKSKDITLTTTYPVLRGPTGGTFEFSVEVDSHLDKDAIFDLSGRGPKGWEINFKPAYESKYISSLQIKANQSRNVSVEVKPSYLAQAGKYPINMRVSSGGAKAEIDLMVVLTGTYRLEAGTPNGLLSLEARQGKPANMSIYIKNTGSAVNHNVHFTTFKPENWKVKLNPEKIDAIQPGEVKQVEVTITPYEEALIGDYSVGVNVQGEKASKSLEFRTTVKASAVWGWIGIAIIVVVIGGLTTLFRKLGRR